DVAGARDLDCDGAIKLGVAGLEDGAERAVADGVENLKFAEAVVGGRREGRGCELVELEAEPQLRKSSSRPMASGCSRSGSSSRIANRGFCKNGPARGGLCRGRSVVL